MNCACETSNGKVTASCGAHAQLINTERERYQKCMAEALTEADAMALKALKDGKPEFAQGIIQGAAIIKTRIRS